VWWLEDLKCHFKAAKMPWFITRHKAGKSDVLSVTVGFFLLGTPGKL